MWKQQLEKVINGMCPKDSIFATDSCKFFPFRVDKFVSQHTVGRDEKMKNYKFIWYSYIECVQNTLSLVKISLQILNKVSLI